MITMRSPLHGLRRSQSGEGGRTGQSHVAARRDAPVAVVLAAAVGHGPAQTRRRDTRMRYIDAFTHFFSKPFFDALVETPAGQKDIGKRVRGIPALYDIDDRLRIVDLYPDYTQVLSLGMPATDRLWGPDKSPMFTSMGNDGLAEICAKYPDRFVGWAASLPMNAPEAAVKEVERVVKSGANAIQLHTNVNGAPLDEERFWPIFAAIEQSGKPILLHPIRTRDMPDYKTESVSKYEINSVIGWPFETGACLARLVFSGIIDTYPKLRVITHHLGGIIPYFEGRVGHSWDQMGARTSDEDYSLVLKRLKKRPFDYFKDFYGDTALAGARGPTICGIDFFTPDHVLFASDCPFDKEKGTMYIRLTIEVMESLQLPQADMEKICFRNAIKMFGLRG
jgi:predicted TIM-barrel fold metal-dependent hydrolase